ncbi:hypothetical protein PHISCL_02802 [Aspergillus sclerotialis]|uniref:MFS maltose permease n=1 Tax=Aspergillus sclerotialis TaxID=2070753 RepID=A0A3A2ZNN8_9EURO|nr:hypothetical protein PHISCL_02802 [Aspergillus sclerotialis]
MLPPRSAVGRIPGSLQLLRSSTHHGFPHQFRPFTNRSRLLLVSPPLGRPQLPFLSPSVGNRPLPPLSIHLRQHFGRLISTETRDYYKRRISGGLRLGLTFYAILVCFQVIKLGIYQEEIEHKWPTPPEWTWKSRWCLRSAHAVQNPEEIGKLITSWPMVAGYLRELIERLEDINGEGKGIVEQADGGFVIEGVGKTGFDVSAKSEPWRRGYFQALIGAAKAAENLEGWVTDWKQRISAPAEYVVGPSNPNPKPMLPGVNKTLHEEDCGPASPSPETFYMKILTTKGFDEGQKLDAALAYADWLDYKGLTATARDMYNWAMDIAVSGSPDAKKVVDVKTGVLKNNGKDLPSENILRVSTAMAVHQAQQGNLPTALSIFTSVLKARRSLPPPPPGLAPPLPPKKPSNDIITTWFNKIKTVFVPVEFPPAPPSGNDPPFRTPSSICEEAGLMTYIGEIIYASSSTDTGLAWTRDATDTAESSIFDLGGPDHVTPNHRCAQCLKVGLENWRTMVSKLVSKAEAEEYASREKAKTAWFGGQKRVRAKVAERQRWEAEMLLLQDRFTRLGPLIESDAGLGDFAPGISLFV